MKKTIVSTNHATDTAARPPVACYHRDARMQVTSDADKEHVLPLYMPFQKDTGNSQKWEFLRPFSSKRQVDYPFYM